MTAERSITVLNPGLLSTIQDMGRYGHQATGFSVSGCMDQRALHDANILLNNPMNEAVIEMLFLGGSFQFNCSTYVSLTGADMQPRLNGQPVPTYTALPVHPGDILQLSTAKNGRYGYLAIAGGFDIFPVLGSKSTNLKCGIGGFEGRKLIKSDTILIQRETKELFCIERKAIDQPIYQQDISVRVVPGPQSDYFSSSTLRNFFSETYHITDQSDRMGYRLDGLPLQAKDSTDIISDGTSFGSIQIPNSGKPIILLADRQTTGGYAKIGTIISIDIPKLVQCMPGARVHFTPIRAKKAVLLYRREEKIRSRLRKQLGYHLPK